MNAEIHDSNGHSAEIYKEDIKILSRKINNNPDDTESIRSLIRIYFTIEDFQRAVAYSDKYLAIEKNKEILFLKINALAALSRYGTAIKSINTLLSDYSLSSSEKDLLNRKLELYKSGLQSASEPEAFRQVSWGKEKTVIGIYYQKSILVGFDNSTAKPFFLDLNSNKFLDDFKDPVFNGLDFSKVVSFSISSESREILAAVSGWFGSINILYKRLSKESKWSSWKKISALNKGSVNSYPNFLPGAGRIVFVSGRDSKNGMDIYITAKENEKWSEPEKLDGVNTALDESSVIIDPGANIIFFSSNGRQGRGGYDLYSGRISKKKNRYTVSNIDNIEGFNTFRNEVSTPLRIPWTSQVYVNYLKSNVNSVYSGRINLAYRTVTSLEISVKDKDDKKPLPGEIKLIGNADSTVFENVTDSEGKSDFLLRPGNDYEITISSPGYVYRSGKLVIEEQENVRKAFYLEKGKIKKGYSFTAENIYFDTGSSIIREESFPDLERIYDFMAKNPKVKINIAGNTDNTGGYDFNMKLSSDRAGAIAEYLTEKGIRRSRMIAEGFGYTKNIASNETETGRQKNRRVEIKVISSD